VEKSANLVESEDHQQVVLAWIVLQENLAYESLLTRISEAAWRVDYAYRKNKSEAEVEASKEKLERLAASKFLYLNGRKPSNIYN
jgi:hypothetical protein